MRQDRLRSQFFTVWTVELNHNIAVLEDLYDLAEAYFMLGRYDVRSREWHRFREVIIAHANPLSVVWIGYRVCIVYPDSISYPNLVTDKVILTCDF